jgi:hypothetical protein
MYQISCPFSFAWVVYPKNPSRSEGLCNISSQAYFLRWGVVTPTPNTPSRRPTPCRLSATAYWILSQLPSISGGRLLQPQPAPWQGTHLTWPHNPLKVTWHSGGIGRLHLQGWRISRARDLTLQIEKTSYSETPVDLQRTTWRCIPEDRTLCIWLSCIEIHCILFVILQKTSDT